MRYQVETRITQEQVPTRAHISALESRALVLEPQEQAARVQAQRERQAEGTARMLVRAIRGMADKLTTGAKGWKPGGRKFEALNDPAVKEVRELVEGLASLPPGEQRDTVAELLVERLAKDPGALHRLSEQVDQVKHGPSHDSDLGK